MNDDLRKMAPWLAGILAVALLGLFGRGLFGSRLTGNEAPALDLPIAAGEGAREGDRVEVLVAKAALKPGSRLKEADVEKMEVPELYLHPQAISARDAGQVRGGAVRWFGCCCRCSRYQSGDADCACEGPVNSGGVEGHADSLNGSGCGVPVMSVPVTSHRWVPGRRGGRV